MPHNTDDNTKHTATSLSGEDEVIAREGDVLVVSYPEVKVPLSVKFAMVAVGGLIYTRRLMPGDDVRAEYDRIYGFLKRTAERDAREKVQLWAAELREANKPPPLPPKPVALQTFGGSSSTAGKPLKPGGAR